MKRWRIVMGLGLAFLALGLLGWGLGVSSAAPGELEAGGLLLPLGTAQSDLRAAYRESLRHLYRGGRVQRIAGDLESLPNGVLPGDLYLPPGEVGSSFCSSCSRTEMSGTQSIQRAYALYPGRVAVMRSSAMVEIESGEVVAMWEIAEIRQILDGYLLGAVPYDILTEDEIAQGLADYDLLIIPTFRADAYYEVMNPLGESGALDAIRDFVDAGGTVYAQSSGMFIAEEAGVLPPDIFNHSDYVQLTSPDDVSNRGVLSVLLPDSPLAYGWLTESLYILDDPIIWPDESGEMEVVAELVNVDWEGPIPAVFRYPYGNGEVIGVVGHPTDPTRREELPLFMNALMLAISGQADFYGDAIQTFNPAYPPHEFPAYEVVPVSVTLEIANLWDEVLTSAFVTETIAPGYNVLTETLSPANAEVLTTTTGHTLIVWDLGELAAYAELTISYQAETEPETLASGTRTFSEGVFAYVTSDGRPVSVEHARFRLSARMAARLQGDRDLEADRHYSIPADGVYLDVALPLENKEETLASSVVLTDWVYLIAPIVDYTDQREILNSIDDETIWVSNEPFLWDTGYPLPTQATQPTQTFTLADWQGDWCVFTGTDTSAMTFTVPVTYSSYISVTQNDEILLPCLSLTWDLDEFPAYWYEEPSVRYGVHSSELLGRDVVFQSTALTNSVVISEEAGSVYVLAGSDPVPFREHLEHATPYAAAAPSTSALSWQDVWSRTYELPMRASFYDVWGPVACATCGGSGGTGGGSCISIEVGMEQHAVANLTYGMFSDLDGDGTYESPVREIPTRLEDTKLYFMGKTYSGSLDDNPYTIPSDQNLIELPIFKGLGVKILPESGDWESSYRSIDPGVSTLISVSEQTAYDHLLFQQDIVPGSAGAFVVSATIESYSFNREGSFKLHDGARLIYNQMNAGINRYEVYDGHVQAAEGWSSDGQVTKKAGPTAVSVYSDTLLFTYRVSDRYDARAFDRFYDPFIKSWGYGDAVWTTYVGGREEKTLFHTTLNAGDHTRVRVSLDSNVGFTLTNLSVSLNAPAGIIVTHLYTDLETVPEPIWPELVFLNQVNVPDALRSVWYFDVEVGVVDEALWGQVLEVPVVVTADNLPAGYDAPPARFALQRSSDPTPTYYSAPAHGLVITDVLPSDVILENAALVDDAATLNALQSALDWDAGHVLSDTAGELFAALTSTISFQLDEDVVTFNLPEDMRDLPSADDELVLVARASLLRAQHGPNVVNEGAFISYEDPFGMTWQERSSAAIVEAHGAVLWVEYYCDGGWVPSSLPATSKVVAAEGDCYIPNDGPAEVVMSVTSYNHGDAIARAVSVTLELPSGVTVTESTPPWSSIDGSWVTWQVGDLAPGAWRDFEIVFWVQPDESEWESEADDRDGLDMQVLGRVKGVNSSNGVFFDDFSQRTIEGKIGDEHWLYVQFVPERVYMPITLKYYNPFWPTSR